MLFSTICQDVPKTPKQEGSDYDITSIEQFRYFRQVIKWQRHLHVLQTRQWHLQPLVQRHHSCERRDKATRLPLLEGLRKFIKCANKLETVFPNQEMLVCIIMWFCEMVVRVQECNLRNPGIWSMLFLQIANEETFVVEIECPWKENQKPFLFLRSQFYNVSTTNVSCAYERGSIYGNSVSTTFLPCYLLCGGLIKSTCITM